MKAPTALCTTMKIVVQRPFKTLLNIDHGLKSLSLKRMADIHKLNLRPAIDEHSLCLVLQKAMGGRRVELLHGHIRKLGRTYLMKASQVRHKLPA